jgi:fluoride exporter
MSVTQAAWQVAVRRTRFVNSPTMKDLLLVGVGGGLGAIARFLLGGLVLSYAPNMRFPLGTFLVNVLGCLAAGLFAGLAIRFHLFSKDVGLFLFTGLLGGFTTFSAFGLETVMLLRRGETGIAAWYVGLSVLCGVAILWVMMRVLAPTSVDQV